MNVEQHTDMRKLTERATQLVAEIEQMKVFVTVGLRRGTLTKVPVPLRLLAKEER